MDCFETRPVIRTGMDSPHQSDQCLGRILISLLLMLSRPRSVSTSS